MGTLNEMEYWVFTYMESTMWFFILFACSTKQPTVRSVASSNIESKPEMILYAQLQQHLDQWTSQGKPTTITPQRDQVMKDLASWMSEKHQKNETINLIFVCTHNSRRSHMSQLWAQAAARYLGLDHVRTYSGGTEATAFNPRSVRALSQHGFVIINTKERVENPIYETSIAAEGPSVLSFSKKFGHESNPKENFAAVMVCSDADTKCPFVPGATTRVALPYIDPKQSDNTPQESTTYLAKSEEIGREMLWMMSLIQR